MIADVEVKQPLGLTQLAFTGRDRDSRHPAARDRRRQIGARAVNDVDPAAESQNSPAARTCPAPPNDFSSSNNTFSLPSIYLQQDTEHQIIPRYIRKYGSKGLL